MCGINFNRMGSARVSSGGWGSYPDVCPGTLHGRIELTHQVFHPYHLDDQCCNASVSTPTLNKTSNLNRREKFLFLLGCPILSLENFTCSKSHAMCVIGSEKNLQN